MADILDSQKVMDTSLNQNYRVVSPDEFDKVVPKEENNIEFEANRMERNADFGCYTVSQNDGISDYTNYQNTDPNYAYVVTGDSVTQGEILSTGENRWYAFQLEQRSKVTFLLQMVPAMDADIYVFYLNTNTYELELIGGSNQEGLGKMEYVNGVLNPGIYYLGISGYAGRGQFAFAFYNSSADAYYEVNDTKEQATGVQFNTDMVGVIDSPYDVDYYSLTITEPTIIQYDISTKDGYELGFEGGGVLYRYMDTEMVLARPGIYYFSVSSREAYSATSTYTVNFKKIGEYIDDSTLGYMGVSAEAGIVYQTNAAQTRYYVNGNPIDITYHWSENGSNAYGQQDYNISITPGSTVWCDKDHEEMDGPRVLKYHTSTMPFTAVESKPVLVVTFKSPDVFYRIHCRCTGAYAENNLWQDLNWVTLLIDPDTGKVVDILDFNYLYNYAAGSNYLRTTNPYQKMIFNYTKY